MFRVRASILGKSILQVGDGGGWRDVMANDVELLTTGFHILSPQTLSNVYERMGIAEQKAAEMVRKRSEAAKKGWMKKRAPVLHAVVVGS